MVNWQWSMDNVPMLRHPALQDLSRDHQLFLLNCRHIRWLADGDHRARPFDETLAVS
jgi:hypothetical protein